MTISVDDIALGVKGFSDLAEESYTSRQTGTTSPLSTTKNTTQFSTRLGGINATIVICRTPETTTLAR